MNRSAWQFDLLPELGELASQLAHPMHDRLAAGSEPAACEADRVTQLAEGSVVVEGFGRAGLPDCFERSVKASELLEYADVGVLVRPWLDVIDELLNLSPTISDPPQGRVPAGQGIRLRHRRHPHVDTVADDVATVSSAWHVPTPSSSARALTRRVSVDRRLTH